MLVTWLEQFCQYVPTSYWHCHYLFGGQAGERLLNMTSLKLILPAASCCDNTHETEVIYKRRSGQSKYPRYHKVLGSFSMQYKSLAYIAYSIFLSLSGGFWHRSAIPVSLTSMLETEVNFPIFFIHGPTQNKKNQCQWSTSMNMKDGI